MVRLSFHRLVALWAFALAVCLPLSASAAIVPVCEHEVASLAPPPQPEPRLDSSCDAAPSADEELGDSNAAPLCDPAGASAVAPMRIYPISDGRIEAAPGCGDPELAPSVAPSSNDPFPASDLGGAVLHAVLVPELVVPPQLSEEAPLPPPTSDRARTGFERGVYHPPR